MTGRTRPLSFGEVRRTISTWEARIERLEEELLQLKLRNRELRDGIARGEPDWAAHSLADCQLALLQAHLRKHRGRRDLAAKSIGISERTFYRWVECVGGADALLD